MKLIETEVEFNAFELRRWTTYCLFNFEPLIQR